MDPLTPPNSLRINRPVEVNTADNSGVSHSQNSANNDSLLTASPVNVEVAPATAGEPSPLDIDSRSAGHALQDTELVRVVSSVDIDAEMQFSSAQLSSTEVAEVIPLKSGTPEQREMREQFVAWHTKQQALRTKEFGDDAQKTMLIDVLNRLDASESKKLESSRVPESASLHAVSPEVSTKGLKVAFGKIAADSGRAFGLGGASAAARMAAMISQQPISTTLGAAAGGTVGFKTASAVVIHLEEAFKKHDYDTISRISLEALLPEPAPVRIILEQDDAGRVTSRYEAKDNKTIDAENKEINYQRQVLGAKLNTVAGQELGTAAITGAVTGVGAIRAALGGTDAVAAFALPGPFAALARAVATGAAMVASASTQAEVPGLYPGNSETVKPFRVVSQSDKNRDFVAPNQFVLTTAFQDAMASTKAFITQDTQGPVKRTAEAAVALVALASTAPVSNAHLNDSAASRQAWVSGIGDQNFQSSNNAMQSHGISATTARTNQQKIEGYQAIDLIQNKLAALAEQREQLSLLSGSEAPSNRAEVVINLPVTEQIAEIDQQIETLKEQRQSLDQEIIRLGGNAAPSIKKSSADGSETQAALHRLFEATSTNRVEDVQATPINTALYQNNSLNITFSQDSPAELVELIVEWAEKEVIAPRREMLTQLVDKQIITPEESEAQQLMPPIPQGLSDEEFTQRFNPNVSVQRAYNSSSADLPASSIATDLKNAATTSVANMSAIMIHSGLAPALQKVIEPSLGATAASVISGGVSAVISVANDQVLQPAIASTRVQQTYVPDAKAIVPSALTVNMTQVTKDDGRVEYKLEPISAKEAESRQQKVDYARAHLPTQSQFDKNQPYARMFQGQIVSTAIAAAANSGLARWPAAATAAVAGVGTAGLIGVVGELSLTARTKVKTVSNAVPWSGAKTQVTAFAYSKSEASGQTSAQLVKKAGAEMLKNSQQLLGTPAKTLTTVAVSGLTGAMATHAASELGKTLIGQANDNQALKNIAEGVQGAATLHNASMAAKKYTPTLLRANEDRERQQNLKALTHVEKTHTVSDGVKELERKIRHQYDPPQSNQASEPITAPSVSVQDRINQFEGLESKSKHQDSSPTENQNSEPAIASDLSVQDRVNQFEGLESKSKHRDSSPTENQNSEPVIASDVSVQGRVNQFENLESKSKHQDSSPTENQRSDEEWLSAQGSVVDAEELSGSDEEWFSAQESEEPSNSA